MQSEQAIVSELGLLVGPQHVLSGAAARRAYDCDAYTVDKSPPAAIALPASTQEVQAIVRWCVSNDVPFTPRGAGTGLSGGSLPALGGVVISTKRLNSILAIDIENRQLLAQTGAVNRRISEAVAHAGLHFAPDPSSQSVSTLGGNIAENSGGPHTLKYGVTVQHVLQVKLVDPLGDIRTIGSRTPGRPGYDLLGIIVGGEGTLGIVTEAWVQLTPNPRGVQTLLAAFPTVRDATTTVAAIIEEGMIPAALEMMDSGILKALRAAFGLTYPEGSEALLLIETDGEPESAIREAMLCIDICNRHHALSVVLAKDDKERARLWVARKKGIGAMGRLAPSIVTQDGVIPRSKLPEMLEFVYKVSEHTGIGVANLFHAGDGNLHPCFYFDDRDPEQVNRVVEAGEAILKKCLELGGSVSGEHGIGVEKLDLMSLMFSPSDLALQADCKRIFNRGSLCNPCKVLPNQKHCIEHQRRWRGVAW